MQNPPAKTIPRPSPQTGLRALQAMRTRGSILGALEVFNRDMGSVFRLNVPGFSPVVLVGPEAARFVLATERENLRWRVDGEPITRLLRHGLLVEDGESHDALRRVMTPALHRRMLARHVEAMWRSADQIAGQWESGAVYDMLPEMRKIALLILTDTLFGVDFTPEMRRLWPGVIRAINYISPGAWVLWRPLARRGYNRHLRMIDDYLYRIIAQRRRKPGRDDDLLGALVHADLSDDLIRDQLMTMLIAGHDTSTASLAWALALMGAHPGVMCETQAEVVGVLGPEEAPCIDCLGKMTTLGQVIDETLRLYPPIHLGSRVAAADLTFDGYAIPAGERVIYSIYLTHRDPAHWCQPDTFDPARFATGRPQSYTYLPFGGGPRNCIGAAFAQVEVKTVLARLLQRYDFTLMNGERIHPHMGATLEPRPGVMMRVTRRG